MLGIKNNLLIIGSTTKSKGQRKRIQAEFGEVLTAPEAMERLAKEKEERQLNKLRILQGKLKRLERRL